MDTFTALLHPMLRSPAWSGWGAAPRLHLLKCQQCEHTCLWKQHQTEEFWLVTMLHFCLYNKKPDYKWIIFIGCNSYLLISAAIFSKSNGKFSWYSWAKWITATPEGADLISPFSSSTSFFSCPDSIPHLLISFPTHKHNSLLFLFKLTPSAGEKTKTKHNNPTYFVSLSLSIISVNWIH